MTPERVIEAKHALAGVAEILSDYYKSLRSEGFNRREAMQLVTEYQRILSSGGSDA